MSGQPIPLRLVFMGTPDFAVPALRALCDSGHEILAVYSQPPKPAGRGHGLRKSPVQTAAEALNLPVRTPRTLKAPEEQSFLQSLCLDAIVVAAYGLLLPPAVLAIPKLGCVNLHASLLPRWRGAAPIQRAILAGDLETGITVMRMEAGLDTGPMLTAQSLPITQASTAQSLHDDLAELAARMIVPALCDLASGALPALAQPEEGVTYAAKLSKDDGRLDWRQSAVTLERHVRGLTPWPGAYFMLGDEPIKVLEAQVVENASLASAGTLIDEAFTLACGQKALRLLKVQRPGKNATEGAALLRGLRLPVGHVFS